MNQVCGSDAMGEALHFLGHAWRPHIGEDARGLSPNFDKHQASFLLPAVAGIILATWRARLSLSVSRQIQTACMFGLGQ